MPDPAQLGSRTSGYGVNMWNNEAKIKVVQFMRTLAQSLCRQGPTVAPLSGSRNDRDGGGIGSLETCLCHTGC